MLSTPDSTLVAVGITKASGNFEVKGLKAGKYILKVQFVGYQTEVIPNIVLTEGQKLTVGLISLSPVQRLLEEIKVSGQRASNYNKIDK